MSELICFQIINATFSPLYLLILLYLLTVTATMSHFVVVVGIGSIPSLSQGRYCKSLSHIPQDPVQTLPPPWNLPKPYSFFSPLSTPVYVHFFSLSHFWYFSSSHGIYNLWPFKKGFVIICMFHTLTDIKIYWVIGLNDYLKAILGWLRVPRFHLELLVDAGCANHQYKETHTHVLSD